MCLAVKMVQKSENGKATGDKLRDTPCFYHLSHHKSSVADEVVGPPHMQAPWSLNEDDESFWSPGRVYTSILLVNYPEVLLVDCG